MLQFELLHPDFVYTGVTALAFYDILPAREDVIQVSSLGETMLDGPIQLIHSDNREFVQYSSNIKIVPLSQALQDYLAYPTDDFELETVMEYIRENNINI